MLLEEFGGEVEEPGAVDDGSVPPIANGGGGLAPKVDPALVARFVVPTLVSGCEGGDLSTLSNGLEDEISKGLGGF